MNKKVKRKLIIFLLLIFFNLSFVTFVYKAGGTICEPNLPLGASLGPQHKNSPLVVAIAHLMHTIKLCVQCAKDFGTRFEAVVQVLVLPVEVLFLTTLIALFLHVLLRVFLVARSLVTVMNMQLDLLSRFRHPLILQCAGRCPGCDCHMTFEEANGMAEEDEDYWADGGMF